LLLIKFGVEKFIQNVLCRASSTCWRDDAAC